MVRSPSSDGNENLKKGPWTTEEDEKLVDHINEHGHGSWRSLPKLAGLNRCGKSCRLRWTNYLRPDIKRGKFTEDEERLIINLHAALGNKWSRIATHLPGRTDNEIKNFWNTHIRKKLLQMGIDPNTHKPRTDHNDLFNLSNLLFATQFGNFMNPSWDMNALKLQVDATHIAKLQILQNLVQFMNSTNLTTLPPNNSGSTTSNNTLFGSQNFNKLFEESSYNILETSQVPICPRVEDVANVWTCFEDEFKQNVIDPNIINNLNEYQNIQRENLLLPPLISDSPETLKVRKVSGNSEMTDVNKGSSTMKSSHPEIFEDWEKLIDDETSQSYWKNILE